MESLGQVGVVQITSDTFELIKNDFICSPEKELNVKGKGEMKVRTVLKKSVFAI